ncbi:MBL fold metallo-hydrolase [Roseovarius sp. S4756]|uniref:MBL fold metallo-hydrolase n=1 Tax=Roseovarius maritimus TaxID=3342637 RepID=UPI003729C6A2
MTNTMTNLTKLALTGILATLTAPAFAASDTAEPVDQSIYEGREILPDPSDGKCDVEKSLEPFKDNLYRHTNGSFPATHSGLVLITDEGALVVDGGNTCVAKWLQDEIKTRFDTDIKYVVQTHAHWDHLAGTQVWQEAGATVIAQRNAIEPIIGEKLPFATPDRVFDTKAEIELGGETIRLHHEPMGNHSNSMVQVVFPRQSAMQCTMCASPRPSPIWTFSTSTIPAGSRLWTG